MAPKLDVKFSVKAEVRHGEKVCIVGNCVELGNWMPEQAKVMHLERRTDTVDGGEAWSQVIPLATSAGEVQYRYFIGHMQESDHEGEDRDIMVRQWESSIKPRSFNIKAYFLNPEECDTEDATFGFSEGKYTVDRGWMIGQTEIHLRFHSNPIRLWKRRHKEKTYTIKCIPLDLRYKESSVSLDDGEESSHEIPTTSMANKVLVSVLNQTEVIPHEQPQFGTVYNDNDYLVFRAQSFEPEFLGFKFDFYEHHPAGSPPDIPLHAGISYILPVNMKDSEGSKTVPITSMKHQPMGELRVEYMIVKPIKDYRCDMSLSYARHWKRVRGAVDVGHRGMGNSHTSPTECAAVRENTVASLSQAGDHGADFVEFDVQLTRDLIPIIYHDFTVCLTLKKKHQESLELFELPISDLNLEQVQMLKLDHRSEIQKRSNGAGGSEEVPEADHTPFPTLKETLEVLDPHIGFNIEIKYGMELKDGGIEDGLKQYMDRNQYIDIILKEILQYAGNRRIIMSCFDPDICTMAALKQNKYPVLFLSQGNTTKYPHYRDPRCWNMQNGSHFALSESLLGITMHTEDLLKDLSLIEWARVLGLVVFCWGEDNNDKDCIKLLKEHGVDGVIYDRIDQLKTTKENIFKMEHKAKLALLKGIQAITSSSDGGASSSAESSPEKSPFHYGLAASGSGSYQHHT